MAEQIRICEFPGCGNLGMPYGLKHRGRKKLCGKHHRLKYGIKRKTISKKATELFSKVHVVRKGKVILLPEEVARVSQLPCSRCGWNESYCDRHRLVPALGYVVGNVVSLCPNCHRIEHRGRFKK